MSELQGAVEGVVGLPARQFWSWPRSFDWVRWGLVDSLRRRDLYEVVLLDDVRALTNKPELARDADRGDGNTFGVRVSRKF